MAGKQRHRSRAETEHEERVAGSDGVREPLALFDIARVVIHRQLDGRRLSGRVGLLDRDAGALEIGSADRGVGAGERQGDGDLRRLRLPGGRGRYDHPGDDRDHRQSPDRRQKNREKSNKTPRNAHAVPPGSAAYLNVAISDSFMTLAADVTVSPRRTLQRLEDEFDAGGDAATGRVDRHAIAIPGMIVAPDHRLPRPSRRLSSATA